MQLSAHRNPISLQPTFCRPQSRGGGARIYNKVLSLPLLSGLDTIRSGTRTSTRCYAEETPRHLDKSCELGMRGPAGLMGISSRCRNTAGGIQVPHDVIPPISAHGVRSPQHPGPLIALTPASCASIRTLTDASSTTLTVAVAPNV